LYASVLSFAFPLTDIGSPFLFFFFSGLTVCPTLCLSFSSDFEPCCFLSGHLMSLCIPLRLHTTHRGLSCLSVFRFCHRVAIFPLSRPPCGFAFCLPLCYHRLIPRRRTSLSWELAPICLQPPLFLVIRLCFLVGQFFFNFFFVFFSSFRGQHLALYGSVPTLGPSYFHAFCPFHYHPFCPCDLILHRIPLFGAPSSISARGARFSGWWLCFLFLGVSTHFPMHSTISLSPLPCWSPIHVVPLCC